MRLRSLSRFTVAAITVPAIALGAAACSSSGGSSSGSDTGSGGLRHHADLLGQQPGHQPRQRQGGPDPGPGRSSPQQTGIKVNLEVIGWNDLQTRIQTATTSGQGPDVLNIGNTWAASLQATGAFLPFDDDATDRHRRQGQVRQAGASPPAARPGRTRPRSRSTVSPTASTTTRRCSPTPASQPPTTWEELVADGAEADRHGQGQLRLRAGGGQLHRERALRVHHRPARTAATVRQRRQADLHQRRQRRGRQALPRPDADGQGRQPVQRAVRQRHQAVNDFATGKAAMILSQNNADNSIQCQRHEERRVRRRAVPGARTRRPAVASFVAGINLSIFKNTKNKDAALKFVKFMTSDGRPRPPWTSRTPRCPCSRARRRSFTDNAEEAKTFADIYDTMAKPLPLVPGRGPVRDHRRQGDEHHVRQDRHRRHRHRGRHQGSPEGPRRTRSPRRADPRPAHRRGGPAGRPHPSPAGPPASGGMPVSASTIREDDQATTRLRTEGHRPRSRRRPRRPSPRRGRWLPYLLLLPAVILELLIHIVPMVVGIWMSFVKLTQFYIANWARGPVRRPRQLPRSRSTSTARIGSRPAALVPRHRRLHAARRSASPGCLGMAAAVALQRRSGAAACCARSSSCRTRCRPTPASSPGTSCCSGTPALVNHVLVDNLHLTGDRPFWLIGGNALRRPSSSWRSGGSGRSRS